MEDKAEVQRQASWRNMLRSAGASMLWLIILLILGGLYLAVNAKAAKAGRAVLALEADVEEARREYAERSAILAELTAPERMEELARAQGFRQASLNDVLFIPFDEVPEEKIFQAPSSGGSVNQQGRAISPAYSETWIEVLQHWIGVGEGR